MTSSQPPVVRTIRLGGLGLTIELPASLRRLRRRSGAGTPPAALPPIELPDQVPPIAATKQSPEVAIKQWHAPPEFWEQQAAADATDVAADDSLAAKVAAMSWYHTVDLPGGVVTDGIFDHRNLVAHYGLPASLAGRRALDVATFDGFWAYELERRGADVTAIDLPRVADLDWPAGMRDVFVRDGLDRDPSEGFYLASTALGSRVKLVKSSVYDLSPDSVGRFDFVHMGDLLLHLRDPMRALASVRSVTADGGTAHIVDAYEPSLAGRQAAQYEGGWNFCTWWVPSLDTFVQMVLDAGFSSVKIHRTFRANTDDGPGRWRAILIATA